MRRLTLVAAEDLPGVLRFLIERHRLGAGVENGGRYRIVRPPHGLLGGEQLRSLRKVGNRLRAGVENRTAAASSRSDLKDAGCPVRSGAGQQLLGG